MCPARTTWCSARRTSADASLAAVRPTQGHPTPGSLATGWSPEAPLEPVHEIEDISRFVQTVALPTAFAIGSAAGSTRESDDSLGQLLRSIERHVVSSIELEETTIRDRLYHSLRDISR